MCVQKYVKSGENDENHNYVCTKIGIMYTQKSFLTELCMYKNRNYVHTKIQKGAVLVNYVHTKIRII